jgi:uncharacterized phage-like protein YoqJ
MEDKRKTCCFTGHRPAKLSFGYDEESPDCLRLRVRLLSLIDEMRMKGVTSFLSGMAQGVDILAAEAVIDIRRTYPQDKIRLIAAVPYEGQADKWSEAYRERYFNILAKADEVITLQRRYTDHCMLDRDHYMVDASAYMIAVYNGSKGGTKYTVDYAISKGLDITIINPDTLARENISPPKQSMGR